MRVLWVTQQAALQGGCESYIFNTVRALSDRGIANGLLYNINHPFTPDFASIFSALLPSISIRQQISQWQPDVIYVHQLEDERTLETLLATRVPVVRFYHDHRLFCLREHKYKTLSLDTCTETIGNNCYRCLGFIARSGGDRHWQLRTLAPLQKAQELNRQLQGHIVASDYMRAHLIEHGFDPARIQVNPLFANRFSTPESPERSPHKLVYAGQLVRGKGVDVLIHAMAGVDPAITLDIYGNGAQRGELEALATQLGLGARIAFRGGVSQSALQTAFATALCVVIPSRAPETFCLTGLEAFATGTPVIASAVGGITQWLHHLHNGLAVPSNSPAELANAITLLHDNPQVRRRMAENARHTALEHFSQDRHIDALVAGFNALSASKVAA